MVRLFGRQRIGLTGLAAMLVIGGVGTVQAGQDYQFDVSFKGWPTAGIWVNVASARMRLDDPVGGQVDAPWLQSELDISSASHPVVEAFYPMRYRLRSLYPRATRGLYLFERMHYLDERTRRVVLEVDEQGAQRFRDKPSRKMIDDQPSMRSRQWLEGRGALHARYGTRRQLPEGTRDYLTLLSAVRAIPEGAEPPRDVYLHDGKRLIKINVAAQLVGWQNQGIRIPAWRYDLAAERVRDQRRGNESVGSGAIWLSADMERRPLRIEYQVDGISMAMQLVDEVPSSASARLGSTAR